MVFLREVILFLAIAGIVIPLLERWRISRVLGFLLLGMAMGPYGLGQAASTWPALAWVSFSQNTVLNELGHLGVVFLLFVIGLELSTERLWALRRWVFGAGVAQVLLSAAALGGLAYAFGNSWQGAVVLGLVLALSSTAVVMQVLAERHEVATPLGRGVLAVLLLQDLAVAPLLILMNVLGENSTPNLWGLLGWATIKGFTAVVVIVAVGRLVLRPLFRHGLRAREADTLTALSLLTTLSMALFTEHAGLSMALGAFLAGLLIAETEYRHEVTLAIEPFKGLLMGLFFLSVGIGLDWRAFLLEPFWVPVSVAGLFVIKAAVTMPLFRASGLSKGHALEASLLLGQGGEFAFIIVGFAVQRSLVEAPVGQFMMLVVGLSMLLTAPMARLGHRAGRWLDRHVSGGDRDDDVLTQEERVLIAGFGRVGQQVARMLERQGITYVAVDQSAAHVAKLRSQGLSVHYGDAGKVELLRRLGMARALAVVITLDQPDIALALVKTVRREFPHTRVFARARDVDHARRLHEAGAHGVIVESLEPSLQLAGLVLVQLGVPEDVCVDVLQQERIRCSAALKHESPLTAARDQS
jgi:monovalent cation:H+ antiporter-2, CPA2 family